MYGFISKFFVQFCWSASLFLMTVSSSFDCYRSVACFEVRKMMPLVLFSIFLKTTLAIWKLSAFQKNFY